MKITASLSVAASNVQIPDKRPAAKEVKHAAARPSTPESGPVSQAQQALRAMPEIDGQRVEELKAAISRGELNLNPESLARAMLDYYRR